MTALAAAPQTLTPCQTVPKHDIDRIFFTPENEHVALEYCARCPLVAECLDIAQRDEQDLTARHTHGVFGGTTPAQRVALRAGKDPARVLTQWVDATAAHNLVHDWLSAGYTQADISVASGVSKNPICKVAKSGVERITASLEQRILAIGQPPPKEPAPEPEPEPVPQPAPEPEKVVDAKPRRVPADHAAKRLQQDRAKGWTWPQMYAHYGVNHNAIRDITHGTTATLTKKMHDRIMARPPMPTRQAAA